MFEYLAEEVFLRQTPDIRRFLAESACLRRLDADACNHALGIDDSATVLRFLEQGSLFVSHDGGYRYHALFADFLHRRSETSAQRREEIHRRAASYYAAKSSSEEAVHHLIAAGDHDAAAILLTLIAGPMTSTGRHHALAALLAAPA